MSAVPRVSGSGIRPFEISGVRRTGFSIGRNFGVLAVRTECGPGSFLGPGWVSNLVEAHHQFRALRPALPSLRWTAIWANHAALDPPPLTDLLVHLQSSVPSGLGVCPFGEARARKWRHLHQEVDRFPGDLAALRCKCRDARVHRNMHLQRKAPESPGCLVAELKKSGQG